MARPKTIDYRRVTFSLPKEVVEKFELRVPKNSRSQYVAKAISKEMSDYEKETEELIKRLRRFREENKNLSGKTSLELLREMRYEGKY